MENAKQTQNTLVSNKMGGKMNRRLMIMLLILTTVALVGTQEALATASFSGKVFNDVNNNAVQDAGEPGLAGWKVTFLPPPMNNQPTPPMNATTDANGNYLYELNDSDWPASVDIPFNISEDHQAGWTQTYPTPENYSLNIQKGQSKTNLNFGNHYIKILGVEIIGPNQVTLGLSTKDILKVKYTNFSNGDPWNVSITAPDGTTKVFDSLIKGPFPSTLDGSNPQIIPINWTPSSLGVHVMTASGRGVIVSQTIVMSKPIEVTPELSTIVLTSAGLLGLVGIGRMRRRT